MKKRNRHGNNEAERQSLATPRWLFAEIDNLAERYFGQRILLDVCAHPENAVAKWFFTEAEDGLVQPWFKGPIFCNPPFKQTRLWLEKYFVEQLKYNLSGVFLLRGADLQTEWVRDFHRFFFKQMITPRVNYLNWRERRIEKKGASFPSMLWWHKARQPRQGPSIFQFSYLELRAPPGAI